MKTNCLEGEIKGILEEVTFDLGLMDELEVHLSGENSHF